MTDTDRKAVRKVAAALSDGQPIDWDALRESQALTESEIDALRLLETIRTGRPAGGAGPGATDIGLDVLEEIGSGSGSRVYRAIDRALGRAVALKIVRGDAIVPEAARERFIVEARALASIDHPNVVRIHSIDEADGKLRLCLELIDGRTIERIVRDDGPLSPEEAARVGIDLCRALSAIHAKGLVHRDLKPANVMRAAGGRTVLLDFGIVLSPSALAADPSLGPNSGTPVVMAPEQFGGSVPVGPKTDIYALGVFLYWAVCAGFPHEAATYGELRDRLFAGPGAPLADRRADVPPAYVAIVEKALAADTARRFESAGAFERALRDFVAGRSQPTATGRRRRLATLVVAAITVAALAAVAAIRFWPRVEALDLDARFFVARDGGVVGLKTGDAVRVGDRLSLEVRCNRESHVYILNEDDAGNLYSMFPAPGYEPRNPLAPGNTHRLPGEFGGRSHDWVVSSPGGGAETILVIASDEPDEAIESFLRGVPPVRPDETPSPSVRLDDPTRTLLFRGIGKTAPQGETAETRREPRSARLEEVAAALERADPAHRVGRLIRLRNVP